MKKEDLVALGLTEEQIAEVQKLNGLDIKREQDKLTQIEADRDKYKGDLEDAQKTLKEFEDVDVEELKTKITTLTTDLETKEQEYQKELAERDFNDLLDKQINSVGAKNVKAVKALLDIDTLKESKNQEADIKAMLESCKEENDYLFGSDEPIKNPVAPTGGKGEGEGMDAFKAAVNKYTK